MNAEQINRTRAIGVMETLISGYQAMFDAKFGESIYILSINFQPEPNEYDGRKIVAAINWRDSNSSSFTNKIEFESYPEFIGSILMILSRR